MSALIDTSLAGIRYMTKRGLTPMPLAIAALSSLLLVGCVTGGPMAPPVRTTGVEIPESLRQETFAYMMAGLMDGSCGDIRIRSEKREQFARKIDAHFRQEGVNWRFFTPEDVVSREEVNAHLTKYLKARGIGEDDREKLCAAGLSEIDNNTMIGSFLKRYN